MIRNRYNRYNQVPHLTRKHYWKVTKTQENITHKRAKRLGVLCVVIALLSVLCVLSSLAIILMGMRELVALL